MTTSKRTTRGAGSRPDNGAATPSAPPPSAPPHSSAPHGATPPDAPSSSAPKVRVRQRKPAAPPSGASAKGSAQTTAVQAPHALDRYASIAQAAYFRSQHRGFKPGYEMEDWLAAEAEVDQRLRGEGRISGD